LLGLKHNIYMSWSNLSAHVAALAPELAAALELLPPDAPLDTLTLAGKPGQTCWGRTVVKPTVYCTVGEKDIDVLVSALQIQGIVPGLKVLEVTSQAHVGDSSAGAVARLLADHECGLETLDLSNCELSGKGCEVLCAALEENSTVRCLKLAYNPLGKQGGFALARMLQRNTVLEVVGLANTSLDTQAAVMLLSVLRGQRRVLDLDLQKAILFSRQEDTTKHAAQMIALNETLQSLNLANMAVGDVGADVLAKALMRNRSLRHLCLANNQIGAAGGEHLAELISSPECCLTSLNLSKNRVGDRGGSSIGRALAQNTVVRRLDLSENLLGNAGLEAVAKGMAMNSTLRKLCLWGNDWPEAHASDEDGGGERCDVGNPSALASFDQLLKGRFAHLDVECDFAVYEIDAQFQVAKKE